MILTFENKKDWNKKNYLNQPAHLHRRLSRVLSNMRDSNVGRAHLMCEYVLNLSKPRRKSYDKRGLGFLPTSASTEMKSLRNRGRSI
jgi:hypothetical protein